MGTIQSGSFAGSATQATGIADWAQGFVSRLPAHGIQTLTNVGANAILSDGDPKAIRNAALGSLATIVGTEATLPLGQAYHAGQVNPFVHKVLHGGIGAGTAAISGGNVWAGAAGAVAGEVAGEVYLGTQTPTLQNANHLIRQASNIGRIFGGLAGLAAGGDPNTGANTGTIAAENNAVGAFIPAVSAAVETTISGLGAAGRACMANATCASAVRNAASYFIPEIVAQFQSESGSAQVKPVQEANKQQAPQAAPPPPEPENDDQNGNQKQKDTSVEVSKGKTVLGHYPEYKELADTSNARRFNIPEDAWNKMSDSQRWEANRKFLDRMVARGDEVQLATPLDKVRPGSYFARELEYLAQKGYRPSIDGTRLIK
jgi:hypothetical protein